MNLGLFLLNVLGSVQDFGNVYFQSGFGLKLHHGMNIPYQLVHIRQRS
jgi:hypothetical protein